MVPLRLRLQPTGGGESCRRGWRRLPRRLSLPRRSHRESVAAGVEAERQQLERLLPQDPCSDGASSARGDGSAGPQQPPAPRSAATSSSSSAAAAAAAAGSGSQWGSVPGSGEARSSPWRKLLPRQLSGRAVGLILMNLACILYGSNWVVVKDSGATGDAYVFCALRFLVAAAGLSPFLARAAQDSQVVRAGVELGVWTSLGYLLQSEGLLTTDASRASFLSTFTVIFVPILAGLSGRGVRPLTWLSACAALAGVSLLEGGGSPPVIGDAWSFLSALAFGMQVFRTEHWSRKLGGAATLPLTAVMLATTALCALCAAAAAHPAEAAALVQWPWAALGEGGLAGLPWQAALWTGILTTDICLLIEVVALRLISSTEAALIFALEPVTGAAFAYCLLGERWGPLGWVGAGVIVASSLATQLLGGEEEGAQAPAGTGGSESKLV